MNEFPLKKHQTERIVKPLKGFTLPTISRSGLRPVNTRTLQIPLPVERLSIFSILGPERAKQFSIGVHGFAENRENRQPLSRVGEGEGEGEGSIHAAAYLYSFRTGYCVSHSRETQMNDGGEIVKPLGGFTWLEFLQVRVSPPPPISSSPPAASSKRDSLFPAFDVHRHLAVILEKHRDRAGGDVHRRRRPRLLDAAQLRRQLLLFPALQLQVGFPAQEPYHVRGQPVALPLRCLCSLISLISLRMRMIFALDGSLFPLALSDDRIL